MSDLGGGGHWGSMLVECTNRRGYLHKRKDLHQLALTASFLPQPNPTKHRIEDLSDASSGRHQKASL
eukprot:1155771-Pelagomonas_calceolata.AAC.1